MTATKGLEVTLYHRLLNALIKHCNVLTKLALLKEKERFF